MFLRLAMRIASIGGRGQNELLRMSNAWILIIFVSVWIALPASQFYTLSRWYKLVKLMDDVSLPDRRKVGWPDIRHTDPGMLFAASGWCSRTIRVSYWRVLLRGLPQSHAIPAEAYSKAKLMRLCMLFALTIFFTLIILMMQAYELAIFVALVIAFIRWLVGNWKEAANRLEATSK